jgi:hypothetical protein
MSDRAGLSEGFIYAPKPPAAPAANIRVSVPPHNKDVFTRGNETISFNIPAGKRGQYLNTRMSYLKFELEVKLNRAEGTKIDRTVAHDHNDNKTTLKPEEFARASHVLALDGGAHALFNSLEVYHGTNLLEQVREYNTLYQLMLDTSTNSVEGQGHYSVSDGMMGIASGSNRRQGALITPVSVSDLTRDPEFEPNKYKLDYVTPTYEVRQAGFLYENGTKYIHKDADGEPVNLYVPALATSGVTTSRAKNPYIYKEGVHLLHNTNNLYGASAISAHLHGNGVDSSAAKVEIDHGGVVYNDTVTYTFCIPLMSGILGPQMGKYIPVGSLAADLKLDLGLAAFEQAFVSLGGVLSLTDGNDFEADAIMVDGIRARQAMSRIPVDQNQSFALKNLELELEYIEVASDVQSAIESATGGQYVMSFDSFSNFQNSIPADAGSFAQLIGAKFSSVKTVLSVFRDAALINRATRRGITSRNNPFSTRPNRPEMNEFGTSAIVSKPYPAGAGFYYSVGATHYPPKPISSDQEAYYEALKSQHMVTSTPNSSVDFNNWTISGRVDYKDSEQATDSNFFHYAQENGTFFSAQNFESQSHKSALAESGINTLSQNMYLHCRFPQKSAPFTKAYKVDGHHDTIEDTHFSWLPFDFGKFWGPEVDKHKNVAISDSKWEQQNAQMQVDHFIHYDGILVIANGICNTRF